MNIPADCTAYVTVYCPIAGWKAVLMWLNNEEPDLGPFWEPWNTGFFAFATREEAVIDAKAWADAEGIPFIDDGGF
jgi:hypothetical protein